MHIFPFLFNVFCSLLFPFLLCRRALRPVPRESCTKTSKPQHERRCCNASRSATWRCHRVWPPGWCWGVKVSRFLIPCLKRFWLGGTNWCWGRLLLNSHKSQIPVQQKLNSQPRKLLLFIFIRPICGIIRDFLWHRWKLQLMEEILHQLISGKYPITYKVLAPSQVVVWDFWTINSILGQIFVGLFDPPKQKTPSGYPSPAIQDAGCGDIEKHIVEETIRLSGLLCFFVGDFVEKNLGCFFFENIESESVLS